ncbi:cilia- and flagella-associated protein 52-like [Penaeus indicus]|uniref:cilia- and flagella-associated protein 52-like n=1 Tax=Penaeus indicus TaxID=29960 RepID=UPI00300C1449
MAASQKEHRGEVTHLALAPNEARVLSCSGDGTCILWELPSLSRLYTLAAHLVFLGGSVLRSGEMVTVGSDGSVLVWDRYDGSLLADLPAATRPITTITASPDDAVLVTAGEDAVIRVWNWVKGRITHEGRGHSGAITKASLSPDGKVLSTIIYRTFQRCMGGEQVFSYVMLDISTSNNIGVSHESTISNAKIIPKSTS